MVFQKRSRPQKHTHLLGNKEIKHTKDYTFLRLKITSTVNFNTAINELGEKAHRVFLFT